MIAAGSTARAARSLCRWEVGFEENTGAGQDMASLRAATKKIRGRWGIAQKQTSTAPFVKKDLSIIRKAMGLTAINILCVPR